MKINLYFVSLLVIVFFSLGEKLKAQGQDFLWAKSCGGTNNDLAVSISVDRFGNIYTVGFFSGIADFDPSTVVFNLTSQGGRDIFVSKVDSLGNFLWAKSIGGTGNDNGSYIVADTSGNIYFTGYFSGTVDFNPNNGTSNLTSAGGLDMFIVKLDNLGNFIWAKRMGGATDDLSNSIALDNYENVYTTGYFNGMVDFNPGVGVYNLSSVGSSDIFISKLDRLGNFLWAKRMGSTGIDMGNCVTISSKGNVFTTGFFELSVDFNPDSLGIFNLTSAGVWDIYISKLDSSGNFVWAKKMGGSGDDYGQSIVADAYENVIISGDFVGTADFDPSAALYNLNSAGMNDVFISKLDSSGNFLWAKRVGGMDNDYNFSVIVDKLGYVYSAGFFFGTADFNPNSGVFNLTSAGSYDIFISKLNGLGDFVWANAIGGIYHDACRSLAIDYSNNIYLAGDFNSPTIIFGSDTLKNITNSGVFNDLFIARLSCSSSVTINPIVCNYFVSPSGIVLSNSGVYTDIIPNSYGCDSVITINLVVTSINSTISQNGNILTANAIGVGYQWLDCNNNFSPLLGETNQIFNASVNGSYSVALSKNGCIDTSICHAVVQVGINENELKNSIEILPNPILSDFVIILDKIHNKVEVNIKDISGRIFLTNISTNTQTINIDAKLVPSGIYILQVRSADFIATKKIVFE